MGHNLVLLKTQLDKISTTNLDDLLEGERLGPYKLTEIKLHFELLVSYTSLILSCEFQGYPDQYFSTLFSLTSSQINPTIDQIRNFTRDSNPTPAQHKQVLIESFSEQLSTWLSHALPIISIIRTNTDEHLNIEEMVTKITTTKNNCEKLIERVENYTNEKILSEQAGIFDTEAAGNSLWSKIWLGSGIILIIATCSIAFFYPEASIPTLLIDPKLSTLLTLHLAQHFAGKIAIMSLLIYLTIFSFRTYKACRHNEVHNKFKKNSLRTFEIFAQNTTDKELKAAVLLQSTGAIYTTPPSGFEKNEAESEPNINVLGFGQSILGKH